MGKHHSSEESNDYFVDDGEESLEEWGEKKVYCICKKADDGTWMVECDYCKDWFHGDCVGLEQEMSDNLLDSYCCPTCENKSLGKSSWKKACRLKGCKKAAIFLDKKVHVESDKDMLYCSAEHGVEFWTNIIRGAEVEAEDIATLVENCKFSKEFKVMGNVNYPINYNLVETKLTEEERESKKHIEDRIKLHQEHLQKWEERAQYIEWVGERTLAINLQRKAEKETEVCGYSEDINDEAWLQSSAPFKESKELVLAKRDGICQKDRRKCQKHAHWLSIFNDNADQEVEVLNAEIENLREREDNLLNKVHVKIIREKAKVISSN